MNNSSSSSLLFSIQFVIGSIVVVILYFTICISNICTNEGHGGKKAAEYLKDHLYNIIVGHPSFITDTTTALGTIY